MRILIVGAGDVGFELGQRLARTAHDITLIESDPVKARKVDESLDVQVIEGSGSSFQVLRQGGIEQADVLAAVSDHDDVNLMACRLAKAAGVDVTIARVRNPEYTQPGFIIAPVALGVDHIIQPEREASDAIVRLLQETSATHVINFEAGQAQLIGVIVESGSPLTEASLTELGQRYQQPPMQIVAVDRNHSTLIPKGNDRLCAGDHIFAVCAPSYAATLFNLAGKGKRPRMDNIMIMGGGTVAQNVALTLGQTARVKIIEQDRVRAERLADQLPYALVLHGDGRDFELLQAESLEQMDSFVGATGDDENNIIATLLARKYNVPRPIVLVNKVAYLSILPTIGLTSAISKQMLTVNAVMQFIQHRQVAAIASVPGLEGQMIEYIAAPGSRITQKCLQDVRFPEQAVVGAVLRQGQLLLPHGETQIQSGDRAVVFTLPAAIDSLDRLFGR